MNTIINPKNNKRYSIYSKEGRKIIRKYLKTYFKNGGMDRIRSFFSGITNYFRPQRDDEDRDNQSEEEDNQSEEDTNTIQQPDPHYETDEERLERLERERQELMQRQAQLTNRIRRIRNLYERDVQSRRIPESSRRSLLRRYAPDEGLLQNELRRITDRLEINSNLRQQVEDRQARHLRISREVHEEESVRRRQSPELYSPTTSATNHI